jgi:ketosteroid isomerase-like protein
MSQETVELIHRGADAFNRRDLGAFLALMDEEAEVLSRLASMEGGYHGHDGVRRYWENLFDVYPDLTTEIIEVRDVGDLTIAEQRLSGHGAGSGTPLEETIWVVSEWRNNKTVWYSPQYLSEANALEAAGRRE